MGPKVIINYRSERVVQNWIQQQSDSDPTWAEAMSFLPLLPDGARERVRRIYIRTSMNLTEEDIAIRINDVCGFIQSGFTKSYPWRDIVMFLVTTGTVKTGCRDFSHFISIWRKLMFGYRKEPQLVYSNTFPDSELFRVERIGMMPQNWQSSPLYKHIAFSIDECALIRFETIYEPLTTCVPTGTTASKNDTAEDWSVQALRGNGIINDVDLPETSEWLRKHLYNLLKALKEFQTEYGITVQDQLIDDAAARKVDLDHDSGTISSSYSSV